MLLICVAYVGKHSALLSALFLCSFLVSLAGIPRFAGRTDGAFPMTGPYIFLPPFLSSNFFFLGGRGGGGDGLSRDGNWRCLYKEKTASRFERTEASSFYNGGLPTSRSYGWIIPVLRRLCYHQNLWLLLRLSAWSILGR